MPVVVELLLAGRGEPPGDGVTVGDAAGAAGGRDGAELPAGVAVIGERRQRRAVAGDLEVVAGLCLIIGDLDAAGEVLLVEGTARGVLEGDRVSEPVAHLHELARLVVCAGDLMPIGVSQRPGAGSGVVAVGGGAGPVRHAR